MISRKLSLLMAGITILCASMSDLDAQIHTSAARQGGAPSAAGVSLANVGDLDGDGIDDLVARVLIGTPYTAAPVPAQGLRVFSGSNGPILSSVFRTYGAFSQFGTAICNLGDTNGDGLGDFATSDPIFGFLGLGAPSIPSGLIQVYQAPGPFVRRVHSEGVAHLLRLDWLPAGGNPQALTGDLQVQGAFPGSGGLVGATLAGSNQVLFNYLPLLLDIAPQFSLVTATFGFDLAGSATFANISRQSPALAGQHFHVQVFSTDTLTGSSNAVIVEIVP